MSAVLVPDGQGEYLAVPWSAPVSHAMRIPDARGGYLLCDASAPDDKAIRVADARGEPLAVWPASGISCDCLLLGCSDWAGIVPLVAAAGGSLWATHTLDIWNNCDDPDAIPDGTYTVGGEWSLTSGGGWGCCGDDSSPVTLQFSAWFGPAEEYHVLLDRVVCWNGATGAWALGCAPYWELSWDDWDHSHDGYSSGSHACVEGDPPAYELVPSEGDSVGGTFSLDGLLP